MTHRPMNTSMLASTVRYLSAVSLLTSSALARTHTLDQRSSSAALGEEFTSFLVRATAEPDSSSRQRMVDEFAGRVQRYGRAIIEDTTVTFLYVGDAGRVHVPSDLNGWNASADSMLALPGTNLFYLRKDVPPAARFEYKFVVDSSWILDPFNKQQAMGGFGANSEIWMPHYTPPQEIVRREGVAHGTVDTLFITSALLGRTHPVFVYLPPGYDRIRATFPSVVVTDGGEYLTLALMHNVLDNLIADRRMEPVVGVFVDPRTDVTDSRTSMRMQDYAMNDTFVAFLAEEVLPFIRKTYHVADEAGKTAVMGASLGGLIATYAALRRPDVFGLCAAQSPSYWWKDDAIIALADTLPVRDIVFSIDTGTIRDAAESARRMKAVLERKGYRFSYAEHPEGHNWVNWRARIPAILTTFWGIRK